MVLGMKAKGRRGPTVQVNYLIHIQEIKPWPPSQSLRSLRSVMIQWENGERSSGSTNLVVPSLGSVIGEGKIEFDESFRLPVTLLRDMSIRGGEADVFQKNSLEFNLYEMRRDKTVKGQLLGTAIIDLAEYGILKETLSVSVTLNCKRNYRNMDQPVLFIKIQPVEKGRTNSLSRDSLSQELSKENNGGDSVSALMNEEYADEAEIASFTDDDVSSHSSTAVASGVESNGCSTTEVEENIPDGPTHNAGKNDNEHPLASETRIDESNRMPQNTPEKWGRNSSNLSSMDASSNIATLSFGLPSVSSSLNHSSMSAEKHFISPSSHSSPVSLVCDHLEEESKTSTRSSDHESLDQEVHEKAANFRTIVTDVQTNSNECTSGSFSSSDKFNGEYADADKYCAKEGENDTFYYSSVSDENENEKSSLDEQNHKDDEQSIAQGAKDHVLLSSNTNSFGGENNGIRGNILKSERLKHVKSVRSSTDANRSAGALGSNHLADVKEISALGDAQNSGGNIGISDKKEAKIYPKEARSTILDSKIQHLENKIRMLEGELREAAAIEAALYSVVAEHGSSMSKVHAPARRLSRLYLHACKEEVLSRRAGAARSSVSGLVLVAKACGNDVPRLTFWLSNSIVLRTIICQTTSVLKRKSEREANGKTTLSLRWKGSSAGKNENTYAGFGNWGDPQVFTSALEKIEAWIFSRIVESIWWQTLTPHMQPVDAKVINEGVGSASRKSYTRMPGSCAREQGDFSLDIWKNAFREACERLCPIRAGGHECGCLPLLSGLIMEQCVARLDVAMFNAILRESADEIPTDPVSDPISDAKVLPIPPGKSSFGAGAQLKTAIGSWSRWLTDLFGMDEDDSLEDGHDLENNEERQNESFKSFHLLNALSDLLMLPKDMLLSQSIRNEVCPMFSAPLIKKILDNFVPDEFCPDPIPIAVLEALQLEDDNEPVKNFPCVAAPVVYLPPSATSIASITGDFGSDSQLRRSRSSVVRKAYTSDDELDELSSPLSAIFLDGSMSPAVSKKPGWKCKENHNESAIRYELLRGLWMNSE